MALRTLVATGAVLAALAGCSSTTSPDASTEPTSPDAALSTADGDAATPSADGDGATATADGDVCPEQKIQDEAELARFVSFGPVTAAQDEGADFYDKEWRYYVPVTVTNPLDVTCVIVPFLVANGSDGGQVTDGASLTLDPGATAELQLLDLHHGFDFTADTQDATPTEQLTIHTESVRLARPYDFYDADFVFGEITGGRGEEVLPVTITKNAIKPGMPDSAGGDEVDIQGLDADGTVVATFLAREAVTIEVGETETVEMPATIASARNKNSRAYQPASTLEDIVEYRVVRYEPTFVDK